MGSLPLTPSSPRAQPSTTAVVSRISGDCSGPPSPGASTCHAIHCNFQSGKQSHLPRNRLKTIVLLLRYLMFYIVHIFYSNSKRLCLTPPAWVKGWFWERLGGLYMRKQHVSQSTGPAPRRICGVDFEQNVSPYILLLLPPVVFFINLWHNQLPLQQRRHKIQTKLLISVEQNDAKIWIHFLKKKAMVMASETPQTTT